MLFQFKGFV